MNEGFIYIFADPQVFENVYKKLRKQRAAIAWLWLSTAALIVMLMMQNDRIDELEARLDSSESAQ